MWKYEFFDINGWLHQYQMFSEFHVNLIERFYGRIYTTTNLPWWYAFSWMPFLMHPIGFVLSCIGIVFFIFDKNKISSIEDAHVDHIERFSEGGKTIIKNGQITHRYCNLHKG